MTKISITPKTLDQFVKKSDELGGPENLACKNYWMKLSYKMKTKVNTKLHPQSQTYFKQQMQLYEEISGKKYNSHQNELTNFDLKEYLNSPTAYTSLNPNFINKHMRCMGQFIFELQLSGIKSFLEMGSGWGFSCEYLARLRHRVTGVDINPNFITAAQEKAKKQGLPIQYIKSDFDDLKTNEKYDVIFFYEAFHHSLRPLELLNKLKNMLHKNGQIALVAEPFIHESEWPHWGIRLDPLSIYCIRKFGWFESGWTVSYLKNLFRLAGLKARYIHTTDSDLSHYLIGSPANNKFFTDQFDLWNQKSKGWYEEPSCLVSKGNSTLYFELAKSINGLKLFIKNHSPEDLGIKILLSDKKVWDSNLKPGGNQINIKKPLTGSVKLSFHSKTWIPHQVIKNNDTREISFHLDRIQYL